MDQIILKEREVKEKIIEAVNQSGLPAFILKPIIKDLYEQLNSIEEQQYVQAVENQNKKNKKEGK